MRKAINILIEEMQEHLQLKYPELNPKLELTFRSFEYDCRQTYILEVNLLMMDMDRKKPICSSSYQESSMDYQFIMHDVERVYLNRTERLEENLYKLLVENFIDGYWINKEIKEIADPLNVFLKDR